jgi:prophage regulatory protein
VFNNTHWGANMMHTILRLPEVVRERGRSRSAHYLDIQQGLFTRPVAIGLRAVGWPANEVAELNAARIAGKTHEEIRALVVKLEAARKAAVRTWR